MTLLSLDVETALSRALERALGTETPPNLAESLRYSLLAPGKRIRPRLTIACGEMLGLPEEAVLPPALALEMLHCFTLIHDDLPCMDNDDYRRGRLSNHKKFGEAVALLAGDALMAAAVEIFLEAHPFVPPAYFSKALRRFTWAAGPRGVIGGQAAELLLTESSTLEDLQAMHAGKTGALFLASLLIPRDLAGVPEDEAPGIAIEQFARELGLAFQVADDLEDEEKDRGKPLSVLFHMTREEARAMALQRLNAACKSLDGSWSSAARGLLLLAEPVLERLEDA